MTVFDRAAIEEAYADLDAVLGRIAGLDYTAVGVPELLELQSRRERMTCAAEVVDHQILAALQTQTTPKTIGAKNWADVLHTRLRISGEEARRRVREAQNLGPRSAITGEPLGPVWEVVAAAQAAGVINAEHVAVLTNFFTALPLWVDPATRVQCEATLVAGARHHTPEDLRAAAVTLLAELDQDGPEPDDDEPDPKRGITISKQRPDQLADLTGHLDPQAQVIWAAIFDKLAAPGMCNPADPDPCTSGTPTQAQIEGDTRSLAQRRHDAFTVVGQMILASGDLGEHNGLPVTVIATCTVTDLERRTGTARTHTGSTLPIGDLIRMAATSGANHYLAVFANHTDLPLYLGRARRTASTAQRFALFARDGGCTRPGCTAPASRSQAHHLTAWKEGGDTAITNLALACGPDNRLVDTGGWTTTMGPDGRVQWTPPPLLDVGQPRTNTYHHPTLYPTESGDDGDDDSETGSAAS